MGRRPSRTDSKRNRGRGEEVLDALANDPDTTVAERYSDPRLSFL